MEVMTFVYPDLNLGGYNSFLYMNSNNNTLFFFADSKEELSSPLKENFDEWFSHATFLTNTMIVA